MIETTVTRDDISEIKGTLDSPEKLNRLSSHEYHLVIKKYELHILMTKAKRIDDVFNYACDIEGTNWDPQLASLIDKSFITLVNPEKFRNLKLFNISYLRIAIKNATIVKGSKSLGTPDLHEVTYINNILYKGSFKIRKLILNINQIEDLKQLINRITAPKDKTYK